MKALCFVLAAAAALALGPARQAQAQSAPKAAEAPKEDFVTEKGFTSRVFEIKHREPGDLASVLRPLGSGYRGATVSANRAVKRLDVAEAAKADIELRLWVLMASNNETAGGRLPDDLKEAVGALKSTLTYRSYTLVSSFVERVRDGAHGIRGEGVTDIGDPGEKSPRKAMQLEYQINTLALEPSEKGPATLRLDGFYLTLVGNGRAQLRTDVTVRDGEKVVVGTSTVQDKGLVVVVSGRVIK
jgi:hypothetical protein